MIDNSSITKQQFNVIYSLPAGFRKILEQLLFDYRITLGFSLGRATDIQEEEMFNKILERLEKFELMLEYSKKWEENL